VSPLARERQVALPWLARLRWIAVVGQIGATVLAVSWLRLRLPVQWIAIVIAFTMLTNLILQVWDRIHEPPDWIAPAVILLDVMTFTVLLYLTGGTDNPFSVLYAIHVAMAVVVLGSGWAWVVLLLCAACYVLVYFKHVQLHPLPEDRTLDFGQWGSLLLVMVLITYFIGRVIRSLRHREQELAEAHEQANRSEHLAALTTLAAGAAHELGTPLSTIALVAKEMERGVDPTSPMADDARLIRQEVDRCRAILDRMRVDVIEDSAQKPLSFDTLAELIQDLRNDLRPSENSRLELITREPDDAVISRTRVLRRAIGVLLRNAFDASPPDGKVRLFFTRANERMIFEVRDSGSGMSQQVLRRAGEPFFTTKPPGEGMGLGLFLVRLAAHTYGGRFELQSSPGAGTCSILELPDRPASDGVNHDFRAFVEPQQQPDPKAQDAGGGRRPDFPQTAGQGAGQPRV
jgi:two-component system sensor histidine kinase RegB